MAIDELSAGSTGVARFSQRPVKNALISNTDNPAVQQYAQVSRFTAFLADSPPPQTEPVERPASAPSYQDDSSQPSSGSGEPAAPVISYSAKGTGNVPQPVSQAGKFISLSI
ncbi:MAG: hypothetical protein OJJ21_23340 [Ferrovibrio sp.]|uniref:hypothetical protein n=1 Tax=Ferrovibrio sp. TaxID=1917215 RepID=UPI002629EF5B|nr:hypothetical protein [Ferrovibrio sp.]MCW0236551.1 hypothetical protein [Ferrovibrio sp.]